MMLVMSVGGVWVLEQPSSSLVYRLPRFQQLLLSTTAPRPYVCPVRPPLRLTVAGCVVLLAFLLLCFSHFCFYNLSSIVCSYSLPPMSLPTVVLTFVLLLPLHHFSYLPHGSSVRRFVFGNS